MLNNQSLRANWRRENSKIQKKNLREIIMPKDDMDKSEEQEMKKIRPIKRNLFD